MQLKNSFQNARARGDHFLKQIVFVFILVFFAGESRSRAEMAPRQDCLNCHKDEISVSKFNASVHRDLNCTACHEQASSNKGERCEVDFKPMNCSRCHEGIARDHQESAHNNERLPVSCSKCHADIHQIQSQRGDKLAIAKKCSECHSRQDSYFESAHHRGLAEGREDAATCTDCHGLHKIVKLDHESKGREFHSRTCLKCHADHEMMKKNKVLNVAAESYFDSFHGKNVRLGYPEKVAACSDCHSAHMVLKSEDPNSSVHKNNLVQTCKQCHENATASFVKYIPHADDHDKEKFPALYWTRMGMTGLLIGTFLFFWIHSLLWAFRSFVENHKKAQNPLPTHTVPDGKKIYRRFKKHHILLHLVVVVSFLALSLTGLPLKFNSTNWGKWIMDALGGTDRARWIHHTAAIVTFGYFFVALVWSSKFLFQDPRHKGTFWEKLFGPDSLFPNRRDWRDLKAMFRWFFFLGPKPTFERWTYWEKFDFMAVFWGMFAIGLSGLLLWFPEFFGSFLPGWSFNIATIVHSDEALLATGFIFTVHFFNTHFRPEKFPMDFVIFNGQVTKEEMLEERGDQWRRYESEGRTEEFAVQKPSSVLWDFVLRVFGFLAVLVGLSLVVGMIYAMSRH